MTRNHQKRKYLEETQEKRMLTPIRRTKWKLIGHTLRKQRDSVTRQALFCNPKAKGKRGRPKSNWKRLAEQELRQAGLKWNDTELRVQDREEWRRTVDVLCSTEELRG